MAAFDLQEQEQIASFKASWQSWGQYIAGAVVIVSLGFLGSKVWNGWQAERGGKASDQFIAVENALKSNDLAKTDVALKAFVADQSSSPLAARGELEYAKLAFDAGKLEEARKALEWVIGNSKETALVDTASLRLANVLIDLKQFDVALGSVKQPKNPSFERLFAETRGDILALKGDVPGAKAAYSDALKTMGKDVPARKIIEIKMSGLGG